MGYGNKADDKDEQRKLMHTILYLSRTWIESPETTYIKVSRRRGGKQVRTTEYTPLLVLERLKTDEIDGIKIPDVVEFHLGAEFYDLLFGERQQYFIMPTALILSYHSTREQQEICLAFYLSNFLILNGGRYGVHFPTMLTESGIRLPEDMQSGDHRLRDALRVVYALEHLQMHGWITRAAHPDMDITLGVELITGECWIQPTSDVDVARLYRMLGAEPRTGQCDKEMISIETAQRLAAGYAYLKGLPVAELRKKRRNALQRLLDTSESEKLSFIAGSLLQAQAEKRETQRKAAIAKSEAAQVARLKQRQKG